MTTEYSVARVERTGEMLHSTVAVWPDIRRAEEYMQWMNHDLYEAMREQAEQEGDSPFAHVFRQRFEGTRCIVVKRDVSDWEPVVHPALVSIDGPVPNGGSSPSDLQVRSEW